MNVTSLGARRHDAGSVALIAALLLSAMMGCAALAIDVSFWSLETVRMQRAADMGAYAASADWRVTGDPTSAGNAGRSVAFLNGAQWTRVEQVSGVRVAAHVAWKVTASRSLPVILSGGFIHDTHINIRRSATVETIPSTAPPAPPTLALVQ